MSTRQRTLGLNSRETFWDGIADGVSYTVLEAANECPVHWFSSSPTFLSFHLVFRSYNQGHLITQDVGTFKNQASLQILVE